MGGIIIPFGKPVKRIQVDIDEKGQVQINGNKKGATATAVNVTVPMSMFEVTVILAGVVASNMLMMGGHAPIQTSGRYRYPDATGHEFLAFDDNPDNCQLCGSHRGNHATKTN